MLPLLSTPQHLGSIDQDKMTTSWRYIGSFIASSILVAVLLLGINLYTKQVQEDAEVWVDHTHKVIDTIEDYTIWFERSLAAQRGAIISPGNPRFTQTYNESKNNLYSSLVTLGTLVKDNPKQSAEVANLQNLSIQYYNLLDYRLHAKNLVDLADDAIITDLRHQVRARIKELSQTEKQLLHTRMQALKAIEQQNQSIVLLGSLISFIFFMLVNVLAYKSVMQTVEIKRDIQQLNERYNLAIQGTADGLFDWDIDKNSVWYSPRLLEMQGYLPSDVDDSLDFFENHLHPDDKDIVLEKVQAYLKGEIQVYSTIFRFRHKDGDYLWIHSRGKALYNPGGKAIRMVGAHTDISHLKMIEAQLVIEKEQAQQASVAKTNFLAHISHEIRTPLNVLINVSKILTSKDAVKSEDAVLLSSLNDSATSLQDLINDFLDISKIESGELSLEERPFQVEKILNQVSNMMMVKAHEKGLAFDFVFSNSTPETKIVSDRLRLRQIVLNLLNNAIKFTPKGSVTLEANMGTQWLTIQVKDTGIGIADEFKEKIFEKFTQADASVARLYGGSGLGLNISVRLAELLGGKLTVESELGKGSVFTLTLPIRMETAEGDINPNTDSVTSLNKGLQNTPSEGDALTYDAEVNRDSSSIEDLPYLPVENKNVLVAEDYDGNILILQYFLNNLGVKHTLARDGESVVAKYKSGNYDLILMDIQMPGMDGIKATRCIRLLETDQGSPRIPIVAMTAHALTGDEQRCRDAGMTDYLTKPLQEDDLKQVLAKYGILAVAKAASANSCPPPLLPCCD